MSSSSKPKVFSALSRMSTNPPLPADPIGDESGELPKRLPPRPTPRTTSVSKVRMMAPAQVFLPAESPPVIPPPLPKPVDRVKAEIERRRFQRFGETPLSTPAPPPMREDPEEEKTPVHNPYRVIDGKVVDIGAAFPSTPPTAIGVPPPLPELETEKSPPTVPETPLALLKVPLPPVRVLNPVWVESRGTRIRNGIFFFVLATFLVTCLVGATYALLWNGRNHQELIQHQKEEQDRQDSYR
jgi:hypothetical protein